jgi:hypothetical protein
VPHGEEAYCVGTVNIKESAHTHILIKKKSTFPLFLHPLHISQCRPEAGKPMHLRQEKSRQRSERSVSVGYVNAAMKQQTKTQHAISSLCYLTRTLAGGQHVSPHAISSLCYLTRTLAGGQHVCPHTISSLCYLTRTLAGGQHVCPHAH